MTAQIIRLVSAVRPKRVIQATVEAPAAVEAPIATVIELPTQNMPQRRTNADYRTREHLLGSEFEILFNRAKTNRHGHRDSTILLVLVRHGFRVSELVDLRWDQIDFPTATLHVRRIKKGTPATHPIRGDELRALRKLERDQKPKSPFVFTSERGGPFTRFAINRLIERLRAATKMEIKAHPHMLRHTCGFKLANNGHDTRGIQGYLGHRNIQHTVKYTEMAPDRFKDFCR
jgi:integrase